MRHGLIELRGTSCLPYLTYPVPFPSFYISQMGLLMALVFFVFGLWCLKKSSGYVYDCHFSVFHSTSILDRPWNKV